MDEKKEINKYLEELNLEAPLLRCCAYYFGISKNDLLDFEELKDITRDLNDYKNVAAIAYFSLTNNCNKTKELLISGLKRISKKNIDPTNLLIIDDMSLFAIAISIMKFDFEQYMNWLQDLIFENRKFNHEKDNNFAIALEEYIHGNHKFSSKSLKYGLVKIWIENNINSKNNVLELQCELAKELWINRVPIFEEDFYNILSIAVVNVYIDEKFKNGIVINESKYQNSLEVAYRHSKRISFSILAVITIIITVGSIWTYYTIWQHEMDISSDYTEMILKIISQVVGLIVIPLGFYKLLPRFYNKLVKGINYSIKRFRGLI